MKNLINSSIRFQLFEIRGNANVYCTVCQIILKDDVNLDILYEHYLSFKHVDNLSNKLLTARQLEVPKIKYNNQQVDLELFSYAKAEAKIRKSKESKNINYLVLNSYFTKCIMSNPKMLEGLEPQTVKAYVKELRTFYLYMFEKRHMSTFNTEILMDYMENMVSINKLSGIMRLFKGFNIPLPSEVRQKVQQLMEEIRIKRISNNNFEEYYNKFFQQLIEKKCYKEAVAIILSKQGMPPEDVHKIQVKDIPLDNEVINLIKNLDPESYLFDNKGNFAQQTRDFLLFRKSFLKQYPNDEKFQQFIRNAGLRSIYKINKQRKQKKEEMKNQNIDLLLELSQQSSDIHESNNNDNNLFVQLPTNDYEHEIMLQFEDSKEQSVMLKIGQDESIDKDYKSYSNESQQ